MIPTGVSQTDCIVMSTRNVSGFVIMSKPCTGHWPAAPG